jgi:putative chitinase
MQLSEHFTLAEFTRSEAAARLDPPDDNQPPADHLANLKVLAVGMEQVRAICGERIIQVSSAYRNPRVNAAVGGVKTSAHAVGLACDFQVMGMNLVRAAGLISDSGLDFDQLIHETSRGILHISFAPKMRRQVLTQAGPAGTAVTKGIE